MAAVAAARLRTYWFLWWIPCWTTAFSSTWGPFVPSSSLSHNNENNNLGRRRMANDAETTVHVASKNKASASSSSPPETTNLKTCDILSLDSIRSTLIRQEETIIFALIERAQFRRNDIVYSHNGGFGKLGTPLGSTASSDGDDSLSFLEYMLVGTETLHCGVRRYTSPEEHAFFPERLPQSPLHALPQLEYPDELLSSVGGAADVNFNKVLLQHYIDVVVPSLSDRGDDEQHGSTVLCDIAVLQALSRRVHYGKFVAESKYRSDPEGYQKLVDAGDADGVMELLTNAAVERQVLRRAKIKAATYGTEPVLTNAVPTNGVDSSGRTSSDTTSIVAAAAASAVVAALEMMDNRNHDSTKIDPAAIETIYRDIIIPLTKVVEVAYLFLRCGKEPPPEYQC